MGSGAHPPAPDGSGHALAPHSTMMPVGGVPATDTLQGQQRRITLTGPPQTWG